MTANITGSNFNSIFTSMDRIFGSQKVGETTTQMSQSKPKGVIEEIKNFWDKRTTIEKVLIVIAVIVVVWFIVGIVV